FISQFRRCGAICRRQVGQLLPALLDEELLGPGIAVRLTQCAVRCERKAKSRQKQRSQKDGGPQISFHSCDRGTASRVQRSAALHSFSNTPRSSLSSLRCAASFTMTTFWFQSRPVTTT